MTSIKDVATHAGVAISTVSKVLNHYPNVSEDTKEKVNRAIEELHFVPNSIASALSSKQSGRVALLINLNTQTQAIDEIDMQYLHGAISKSQELKMDVVTVFFSMLQNKKLEEVITYFKAQNISGIVIVGLSKEEQVLHELIATNQFKVVLVDAPIINRTTSCVWVDQKKAQKDVARKTILENPVKKVLYLAGKSNGYVTERRLQAMKELARELKVELIVKIGNFSELEARKLTLQLGEEVDCVVCASDLMAIGAMRALMDMDIFRPVCGFDGITLMGYAGKQMNTVAQNFYEIGAAAILELEKLMNGQQGQEVILPHKVVQMQYLDIIS